MGDIIQLNVGGMRYADVMTSLHKLRVKTVLFGMKFCAAAFDFDVMRWALICNGNNHVLNYKTHDFELVLNRAMNIITLHNGTKTIQFLNPPFLHVLKTISWYIPKP